jgi:glycerol-3-phosphate O-acyltransferase
LRLSQYANGIRFFYYRRVFDALRCWFGAGDRSPEAIRERLSSIVEARQSVFVFLRTARLRDRLRTRREQVASGQRRLDLIAEILRAAERGEHAVHVVPIALFWRKGPLPTRRFVNLPYSTVSRPSDLAKVTSFLIAYRDLAIKLGEPVALGEFRESLGVESTRTAVRALRRKVMRFFAAEERVVEGPRLRPVHRVQRILLRDPTVRAAIAKRMEERGTGLAATRHQAEKLVREIAANLNPTLMAFANMVIGWVFKRLFASIDTTGLEKVARYAREHPVILVPSHRSYFDFLILSWLFYRNYLVPPHIAARENMAFGPFGFLFRRLGAFFLRKSFDDDLYKAVFRAYLAYLVREGYTQEFFKEPRTSPRRAVLDSRRVRGCRPARPVLRPDRHQLRATRRRGQHGRRA